MDTKALLHYCFTNAERKLETAEALFKSKRYADCLFFCHLGLEFLLKGVYVNKKQEMFPMTHDLEKIIVATGIQLKKVQKEQLKIINTFNIAGRYDDYKLSFYKIANRTFAKKYLTKTKQIFLWVKNQSNNEKQKSTPKNT